MGHWIVILTDTQIMDNKYEECVRVCVGGGAGVRGRFNTRR